MGSKCIGACCSGERICGFHTAELEKYCLEVLIYNFKWFIPGFQICTCPDLVVNLSRELRTSRVNGTLEVIILCTAIRTIYDIRLKIWKAVHSETTGLGVIFDQLFDASP